MKIIVRKEDVRENHDYDGGDFTAWVESRFETRQVGRSTAEAVGSLIQAHSELFNIQIEKEK